MVTHYFTKTTLKCDIIITIFVSGWIHLVLMRNNAKFSIDQSCSLYPIICSIGKDWCYIYAQFCIENAVFVTAFNLNLKFH